MGGLSRRAVVVEKERAEGTTFVADGGGLFLPHTGRTSKLTEQSWTKAELLMKAYATTGIDALALSNKDWSLGVDRLGQALKAEDLPVLAGNLTCGDQQFAGTRVVERDGVRVGFLGITVGSVDGCEVAEPNASLKKLRSELGSVDLVVALVPAITDGDLNNAMADVAADVVISSRGRHSYSRPVQIGSAWVLDAGSRGKSLGRAKFQLNESGAAWSVDGATAGFQRETNRIASRLQQVQRRLSDETDPERRAQYEAQELAYRKQLEDVGKQQLEAEKNPAKNLLTLDEVGLNAEVGEHPVINPMVQATKEAISEAAPNVGVDLRPYNTPDDSLYVGATACAGCHALPFKQWTTTPHSHAWKTLIDAKRQADEACFSCHSTGANLEDGPTSPAEVLGLRDVQCESCHGPGRAHSEDTSKPIVRTPTEQSCTVCHDGKQDNGDFDFATYFPKVVHVQGPPAPIKAPTK